ncbi:uncharacterized protein LOC104893876 [Beta vulgaris subsp. vulgaris]|uniref:uncharacterized protein LOC104893876 n=1 Tax=Beta vulgaris subsp. vulgaris TaxID=3555 RepID=UPI00053F4D34|nr:uncharacterized protein LOC104893876 [Beta vulgaris subsp. vulgaris]
MVSKVNAASQENLIAPKPEVVVGIEIQENRGVEIQINEPSKKVAAQATPKTWSSVATEQKLIAKGMSLKLIVPSIYNGRNVAKIDKSEVEKLSDIWANDVVDSMEDRNAILCAGPNPLNNRHIIVKAWTTKFNFHEEIMRLVPLWVRFPNLPLNCWGPETVSSIGSIIGVSLFVDECTTRLMRVSYARLLVEFDVTKLVPRTIHIKDYNGNIIEQKVQYDWVPLFAKNAKQ